MIDINTRQKLSEDSRMKTMISSLGNTIANALSNNKSVEKTSDGFNLNVKFKEEPNQEMTNSLDKVAKALVALYNQFKSFKIQFPKIYRVEGAVDINSIADVPPIEIKNLSDLKPYFESMEKSFGQMVTAMSILSKSSYKDQTVQVPTFDTKPLLSSLQEVRDAIENIKPASDRSMVNILRKVNEGIGALVDRPQMTTPPVTHISLNALQGFIKTTSATVGSTLVQLPTYGVLSNRRAVYIYNNGANTIYVGGSDVTTSNGIPVPSGSTSPILDAGVNTLLYGIAITGNNDVRIMEISDENSGR